MENIIILAAGMGRRLLPHTIELPKALLPMADGTPLIQATLDVLVTEPSVESIVVVGGYQYIRLEEFLAQLYPSKVTLVFNECYEELGPLYSLWCGLNHIQGHNIWVMNADTFFKPASLSNMLQHCYGSEDAVLFASNTDSLQHDDVQVRVRPDMRLQEVGKSLTAERRGWKSAGVFSMRSAAAVSCLRDYVEGTARLPLSRTLIWHQALNHLADCDNDIDIRAVGIPATDWWEVDDFTDFEKLAAYALEKDPTLLRRGGGL